MFRDSWFTIQRNSVAAASAPGINQKIINIGSGTEMAVRDLVSLVLEVTGGSPEVVYNPRNEGGVKRMCADMTQAAELLNFRPAVDLRTGLRLTFEQEPSGWPSWWVASRLSGRALCSVAFSASGWFRPSAGAPSPS